MTTRPFRRFAVLVWLFVVTVLPARAEPSPEVPGAPGLPTPPAQGTAWTAPATSLPAKVVRATATLFDLGMADPRGCEYREVEIDLGYSLKTHAWVLPAGEGQARYAVGWNGLVYPGKNVGAPADLAGDLAASTAKWTFRSRVEPFGEPSALSTEYVLRLKVAMLLRLGEKNLAEKYWQEGHKNGEDDPPVDPYTDMTTVWLGSWYNTAVRAYLRDDYAAALMVCHRLSPVLAKAREIARAQGTPDPWPERHDGLPLWQMPLLLAESQRRVDEQARPPAPDSGQPTGEAVGVAQLIRELDRVRVHQMMMPGQVDVLDDPVVKRLVAEGDAAVPALLRCLVEDQRLTRSRYTGGGWTMESGPIIPVYEAAYTALFRLLDVKFPIFAHDSGKEEWLDPREPRHLSPEDRRVLADKLETFWSKRRGVDPVERAYATLRDDAAGEKAWLQAVDTIVQPTNGQFTNYLLVRPAVGSYWIYTSTQPFTLRGESLRGRTDPSVAELMVRRFDQLSPGEKTFGGRMADRTGKYLLALAAWDGKAHLDDLRRLHRELQARFQQQVATLPKEDWSKEGLFELSAVLPRLHEVRARLGDDSALEDYANFIESLPARMLGTTDLFLPMWRHPDAPAILRAADKIFSADSPWTAALRHKDEQRLVEAVHTRLISLPAFRQAVLRGLDDTADAAEVSVQESGYSAENGGYSLTRDALTPPAGTKSVYRVCDRFAHALSAMGGFPHCELFWSLAERDRAVKANRAFLQRYADNFRYRDDPDRNRDSDYFPPSIYFPKLDHPATEEDVHEGRAVFSLPPPARQCRLPNVPLSAERAGVPVTFDSRGRVWQAEETLVDGRWERFFGFVGRDGLVKVPAGELEFPIGRQGGNIAPQIAAWVEVALPRPPIVDFYSPSRRDFLSPDKRMPVQIKACNHGGFDQTLPGAMVLPPGADPGTLPPGVRFVLAYSEKMPERNLRYNDPPFDYGTWRDVPPRAGVRTVSNEAPGPVLLPGVYDQVIVDADLRDYFDLDRPGSYRLEAVFQLPGQPEVRTSSAPFAVGQ